MCSIYRVWHLVCSSSCMCDASSLWLTSPHLRSPHITSSPGPMPLKITYQTNQKKTENQISPSGSLDSPESSPGLRGRRLWREAWFLTCSMLASASCSCNRMALRELGSFTTMRLAAFWLRVRTVIAGLDVELEHVGSPRQRGWL